MENKESSLEKTIKHIADTTKVSYEGFKKWSLTAIREAQKKYKKIEIEISEEKNDLLHRDIVVDDNINMYRRIDSVHMIKDRDVMIDAYKRCSNSVIKKEIISICKLQEIYDLALHEKDFNLKVEAIRAIHNEMRLKEEAEKNSNYLIRIEAIKKLKGKDLNALQRIILIDSEPKVIKVALNQIYSTTFLESFISDAKPEVRQLIYNRIHILKGEEDYLKKSVEDLISNYG